MRRDSLVALAEPLVARASARARWAIMGLGAAALALTPAACHQQQAERPAMANTTMAPEGPQGPGAPGAPRAEGAAPMIVPGEATSRVIGTAPCVVDDTRKVFPQIQRGPRPLTKTPVRNFLPDHPPKQPIPEGPANNLKLDGPPGDSMLAEARTVPERLFPSDVVSGWNPPDPTCAVGPNHVVVTANANIAFYDKVTGAEQFEVKLDNTGNPGFFEPLGAGGFTFDCRCVYDHFAQRFIVMALETYNNTEAWIDIAISDDSDPNGVWYKYRTDAVLTVTGGVTVWWDFPGLGFDQNNIYITGNLFGLSASGGYGAAVRVFDKAPLLSGQTAVYSTLASTVYTTQAGVNLTQPANNVGILVNTQSSTQMRFYGVTGPASSATIQSVSVAIPARTGGPGTAPNGAGAISSQNINVGGWTTPIICNDRLVIAVNGGITVNGVTRSAPYWYEFNLNGWPTSGSNPTLRQSGVCDPGPGTYGLYPAAITNLAGDIGLIMGVTRADSFAGMGVAARRASDPLGKMGAVTTVFTGSTSANGRWGDYFSASLDPTDDAVFWGIAEYNTPTGWENWVASFRVTDQSLSHPLADEITVPIQASVTAPQTIDVLANDWHSTNATLTIASFDATSAKGGTISRSVGTGPGGRDRLIYTPPSSTTGIDGRDVFNYTVTDGSGNNASAAVVASVYFPSNFRTPENPSVYRSGVQGTWYDHPANTANLVDYSALTPAGFGLLTQINQASTAGALFASGRNDTAAVFEGFIEAPTNDLYTLFIESDDGSRLKLGGVTIIDNDGNHAMTEKSGVIGLKPGRHSFRIEYYDASGAGGLILRWQNSTITKQVVPAARLTSVRPCPTALTVSPGNDGRSAVLSWKPPQGFDPPSVLIRRNGVAIATLPPGASTYTDLPPLPPTLLRHVVADYTIEGTGANAPVCAITPVRVPLSSGDVRFAENFDGFADAAALTAAGWQSVRSGNAVETADWTVVTTRPAPASINGAPSAGKFVISDSDRATGTNPTGGGASHDLITPAFNCAGMSTVVLHADVSAQLNNNGTAIFDIDVSSDQNPAWTNVLRRVATGRTIAPASSLTNADGVYGRLSLPLGAAAANRTGVRLRFRHFEPTDDWFIGIDNILVDNIDESNGGQLTLLANESFAGGISPRWTISSALTGNQTWTTNDPCQRAVAGVIGATPTRNGGQAISRIGTRFAMVDSSCFTTLVHDDKLATPAFDCTYAARVFLSFKSECLINDAQTCEVLVSTDGGTTYSPVFSYSRGALHDSAEDPVFNAMSLHVPEAAGQQNVKFAFRFANSSAASWWAIDDVRVSYDPRCPADIATVGVGLASNGTRNPDGQVTVDDLIAYLTAFFGNNLQPGVADIVGLGGIAGADGQLSVDDLVAFLNAFFAPCE